MSATYVSAGAFDLTLFSSTPSATWHNAASASRNQNPTGTDHDGIRVDYSENVASGSWTVTANRSGSANPLTAVVSESSGVATSTSLGAANAANSTANVTSLATGSITPTAGSILYAFTAPDNQGTAPSTIDNSFTVRSDPAGGVGTCWDTAFYPAGDASKANVSAVAVNPTWTDSGVTSGDAVASIVEFLAAAGGGPTLTEPPMRTLRGAGL